MNRVQSGISAIIVLAMFVINQFGWAISESEVTELELAVATLATTIWALWKNHNFTEAAVESQQVLEILKDDQIDYSDCKGLELDVDMHE